MASRNEVSDSEGSEDGIPKTPEQDNAKPKQSPPQSVLSYRFRESPKKASDGPVQARPNSEARFAVVVPAPIRPWEYQPFRGDITVDTVLEEIEGPDNQRWFRIEYEDGRKDKAPLNKLIKLRNGRNALDLYENEEEEEEEFQDRSQSSMEPEMYIVAGKRSRTKPINNGFVDSAVIPLDSEDDDLSASQSALKKRRLMKGRVSLVATSSRHSSRPGSRLSHGQSSRIIEDDEDSDPLPPPRRSTRAVASDIRSYGQSSRRKPLLGLGNRRSQALDDDDDELAGDGPQDESDGFDIVYRGPKAKKTTKNRRSHSSSKGKRGTLRRMLSGSSSPSPERETRRSRRQRPVKNMREHDMDEELYADDVINNGPKVISIREIYQSIDKDSPFRVFHNNACDVCGGTGTKSNKGISPLIHCQGCSTSIHKVCLGYRSGREHMVTKVGHENFVMQCRRCIGMATKKDPLAPRLDTCQFCKELGPACSAFSSRKTAKQEEKLREENDGEDPITIVAGQLINNSKNVLFRCTSCNLAHHFEHLPSPTKSSKTPEDTEALRELRLKQYSSDWRCLDCHNAPAKVQTLVAWRTAERDSYSSHQTATDFREDEKEYLVKWEDKSYFHCTWMPGGWVWGVTAVILRNAFFKRDEGVNLFPKWTNEEAIPEEFLRMEIIFEVSYNNAFRSKSEKADKAAISMVDQVLVKFQGLGYEEAVWEEPPEPEDEERWSDFVAAYNEYIAGKYFKQASAGAMKERVDKFRALNFEDDIELKEQPAALTGGKMMPYQMEGLNWLLYNFHQNKNVILADEMGLGKTIQIIALLASLVKGDPKCWPFLIVTPNSTCPNWRREIKKWAPSLRVVAYYGVRKARDMAMKYELYPDGSNDLRAHVVVTSYEAPVDDNSKSFFRKIKWSGMIVDEGQRLKNDENLLYGALKALKIPFQVLLTGTPLQNNKRELFNLLQFLDTSINAAKLDEKYEELTKENLPELHNLIRPFFLRRTKLQVLKFLPPMAQVILPVTMSVVQKKLYKSILAKNPQLIQTIFGQSKTALGAKDRSNLNNILMQLRKCLCHPFVYSAAIEERSVSEVALYRNLVDASSKFQLLEIMLPKLHARGHRVLMFSQFLDELDLIEDFLNGLGLSFERLDGTIGALEKQRRIDAFNAPNSALFAFLLSTRSGGVGINLATADTVIIMDPDFNPHQDIQALSRAHRIGQKKKVLCFQLMTKDSAEEKIVQIGRKKMALDQALIESLDKEDDAGVDLESILKFGAEALFSDDDRNDIHYDSASVDKLLDRTLVETTDTDEGKTAESQFSFARIWANDKATLTDDIGAADAEAPAPDFSVWEKILKQREADAAREAARNAQTFGRGKRQRGNVNYDKIMDVEDILDSPPVKPLKGKNDSPSDLDFASAAESEAEEDSDFDSQVDPRELESKGRTKASSNKVAPRTITLSTPSKSAKQQGSVKRPAPPPAKKPVAKDPKQVVPNKPSKPEKGIAKQLFAKSKSLEQKNANANLKQKMPKMRSAKPPTPSQPSNAETGKASTALKPGSLVKTTAASTQEQVGSKKKPSRTAKNLMKPAVVANKARGSTGESPARPTEPHSEEPVASMTNSQVQKQAPPKVINSAACSSNANVKTSRPDANDTRKKQTFSQPQTLTQNNGVSSKNDPPNKTTQMPASSKSSGRLPKPSTTTTFQVVASSMSSDRLPKPSTTTTFQVVASSMSSDRLPKPSTTTTLQVVASSMSSDRLP